MKIKQLAKRILHGGARTWQWSVRRAYRVQRWWVRYDRQYKWKWRFANIGAAVLIVAGASLPILGDIIAARSYELSADTLKLIGPSSDALNSKLTYNSQLAAYQFNTSAITGTSDTFRQQTGTAMGDEPSTYALDVHTDIKKGVTYYDTNSQLSFTLKPQFSGLSGKEQGSRIVFPLGHGAQAIYSLKGNGLKEDIVASRATSETMSFAYDLELPKTLEARMLPDGSGGVGIYSADPSLYGDVSYGSDSDRQTVEKARETSPKNYLVFGLPAPTIKSISGQLGAASAHFELDGSTLKVVADHLNDIDDAFTIDPSVVVTSASDFATGNDEGMIDFDPSGQITRSGLTGGSLGTGSGTTSPASPPTVAAVGGASTYSSGTLTIPAPSGAQTGSLIVVFIRAEARNSASTTCSATNYPTVSVSAPSNMTAANTMTSQTSSCTGGAAVVPRGDSPVDAFGAIDMAFTPPGGGGGTIGTDNYAGDMAGWYYAYSTGESSYSFSVSTNKGTATASGYALRITGGPTSGNPFADSFHSEHTAVGGSSSVTVAGWTPAAGNNLLLAGVAASGGFSSAPSGWSTTTFGTTSKVSLAQLSQPTAAATGNLTFSQETSPTGLSIMLASVGTIRAPSGSGTPSGWQTGPTLNNFYYRHGMVEYNGNLYIAGGSNTTSTVVERASINSDGSVGSWTATSSLIQGRVYPSMAAYNGYLYVWGGWISGTSPLNEVEYAKINSDGSLGNWTQSANSMTHAVCRQGGGVWNGYIYAIGGAGSNADNCGNSSTPTDYVQYAPLLANGDVGTWQVSSNSLPVALMITTTTVYNGYIYAMEGTPDGSWHRGGWYAPLLANGDIGAWQTLTDPEGGYRFTMLAYSGYMYFFSVTDKSYYAQINANGSLGAWQPTVAVPGGSMWGMAGVAYNGYIYLTGGSADSSTQKQTVYAKINTPGSNTEFSATGNPNLPSARSWTSAVAYNGYVYVLGGCTDDNRAGTMYNNVMYAPIDSDGTVGSWTTSSNTFVNGTGRCDAAAVAVNGYLYVLGGHPASGDYRSSEVQYAIINNDGSIGTWTDTTSLDVGRIGAGAWAYNGRMYVVGGGQLGVDKDCGNISSSKCNEVLTATINSNGTLGPWSVQSTYLPRGTYAPVVALNGNYVYVANGDYDATPCTNIYMASIDGSSGEVSSWVSVGGVPASFGSTCQSLGMAGTSGGYLYGWGNNSSASRNRQDVWYAKLNSDGTLASDSGCGSAVCIDDGQLSSSIALRSGFIYQGIMYTFGGYDNSTGAATNEVVTSQINNGGSSRLGSFTNATHPMPNGRENFGTVVYNGKVYVIGGRDSTGTTYSSVYYASIDPATGDVGSWQATSNLPFPWYSFTTTLYNGYIYILGGKDSAANIKNVVYYAKIKSDGSLSNWTSTSSFITSRTALAATAYNGFLYITGGTNGSSGADCSGGFCDGVQYASISADGTLGAWHYTHNSADDGTSYVSGVAGKRYAHVSFAYDGYLYVLGGTSSTGGVSNAQYAKLNSNGTVQSWNYTTSMPMPIRYAAADAANGFLYVAAGTSDGTNGTKTIQVAQIADNGALTNWSVANSSLSHSIYGGAAAIARGNLYMLGGYGGGITYPDVQYAALNSIARVGHYSKLVDLGSTGIVTGVTYSGMLPGGDDAVTYRAAGSDGLFGDSKPLSQLASQGCAAGGTRYLLVTIALDDTHGLGVSGSFPDSGGAYLTDFTVNYKPTHPTPETRLRGGKTLQQGVLSGLDVCGS